MQFDIIDKLINRSVEFRKMGEQTVGVPSLSKSELIKIYDQI